jgi:hypothetical protein
VLLLTKLSAWHKRQFLCICVLIFVSAGLVKVHSLISFQGWMNDVKDPIFHSLPYRKILSLATLAEFVLAMVLLVYHHRKCVLYYLLFWQSLLAAIYRIGLFVVGFDVCGCFGKLVPIFWQMILGSFIILYTGSFSLIYLVTDLRSKDSLSPS